MLDIIVVSILALVVIYLLKSGPSLDGSELTEPRTALLTIGVQIICGNCSGDGERPIKTYLDRRGNCSQCGGRSYMLASDRIVYAQQIITARRAERGGSGGQTRVQPVEASTNLQSVQIRRASA